MATTASKTEIDWSDRARIQYIPVDEGMFRVMAWDPLPTSADGTSSFVHHSTSRGEGGPADSNVTAHFKGPSDKELVRLALVSIPVSTDSVIVQFCLAKS